MDDMQVTIVLQVRDINVLLAIVAEKPLKDVAALFNKIRMQADQQVTAMNGRISTALNPPAEDPNTHLRVVADEPA